MAIKVQTSYKPATIRIATGVTAMTPSKVTIQGSSVTPQKPTVNPQPQKAPVYQAAATTKTYQKAQAANDAAAARRFAIAQEKAQAAAAIQRKRLADAKQAEIGARSGNWFTKTAKNVASYDQRVGRETAFKYAQDNERVWAGNIIARQNEFERKASELKNWVMQSGSESEWNRRVKEAERWLNTEEKTINSDIDDYTKTQAELMAFSQQQMSGTLPALGRGVKSTLGKVTSAGWNALTWTASQPQRLVNTAKNFVNPNNKRMYYGGDEKKGGLTGAGSNMFSQSLDQLKKSYNASRNQRTVGFSKEDEARRLETRTGRIQVKTKNGYEWRDVTRKPSGLDAFRVKYGDDIADFALDPLAWLPNNWAARGAAAVGVKKGLTKLSSKGFELAGKNKFTRDFVLNQAVRQSDPSSLRNWFKKREGTRLDDFYRDNKAAITERNLVSEKKKALVDAWKGIKGEFNPIERELRKLSDGDARLLQEYILGKTFKGSRFSTETVKPTHSWQNVELPRNFGRQQRRHLEDLARGMKGATDRLRSLGIDYAEGMGKTKRADLIRKANNRAYVPQFVKRNFDEATPSKGGKMPDWYLKSKTGQTVQSSHDLAQSFGKRYRGQMWAESPEGQSLGRYYEPLDTYQKQLQRKISIRKQGYKPNQGSRFNDFGIKKRGFTPTGVWKKSVLKYDPAWYVNGVGYNIPASLSAAGPRVIGEFAKIMRHPNQWKAIVEGLPEGVLSGLKVDIGRAAITDDMPRVATFLALKKKGLSDADAIKQVDRWLFSYKNKNYERPLRAIAPFMQWQKNLLRLSTTMPFHAPRSAKAYSDAYKTAFQRPYEALPNQEQTYKDEATGQEQTFNPKEFYKGKAKIGDNWMNLPFFALNPEKMLEFGINPYLASGLDYLSGQDKFGRTNTNRKAWTILAERFPQINLARAQANRNNMDTEKWFAAGGNSKMAQGYDASKPNYKESLDNNAKFGKVVKSFLGVPRAVKYDAAEYDRKARLSKFNKDFFAKDWDVRLDELKKAVGDTQFAWDDKTSPYNQLRAEQESLAKKYGFDLQKDIYDNYWSKYDTENTKRTKQLKRSAYDFNSDFWRDYISLPQGSKTQASVRRPFLLGKYDEWKKNNTFAENPYYDIPKFNVYDAKGNKTGDKAAKNPYTLRAEEAASLARRRAGKLKYQRYLDYQSSKKSGDLSAYEKRYGKYKGKSSPWQYDGKFFKSEATMKRYKEGALWDEYYKLTSSADKQAFFVEHPELRQFEQPTTQAEWDELRLMLREKRNKKLAGLDGFTARREKIERRVADSFRTKSASKRLRYKF